MESLGETSFGERVGGILTEDRVVFPNGLIVFAVACVFVGTGDEEIDLVLVEGDGVSATWNRRFGFFGCSLFA